MRPAKYEEPNTLILKVEKEFTIKDRGKVIVVDLIKNGYKDLTNKDMRPTFMNKFVIWDGIHNQIVGIETMGAPDREVDTAGFLLKPMQMTGL